MENLTRNLVNSSSRSSSACPVDARVASTLKAVAYAIIITVSLIGNIATIVAVRRDKVMKKTINLFIANICVADLVITFVYLPRLLSRYWISSTQWMIGGTLGTVLCKVVPYINHVAVIVSILMLLALSIDRFQRCCLPFETSCLRKDRKNCSVSELADRSYLPCSLLLRSNPENQQINQETYLQCEFLKCFQSRPQNDSVKSTTQLYR